MSDALISRKVLQVLFSTLSGHQYPAEMPDVISPRLD
jgi:hypothetical protein